MNFEALQKTWQSQDASAKVTINADVLLKEVRRNQRHFWATIFWRDVREVGVAFLLTLFFRIVACGITIGLTVCWIYLLGRRNLYGGRSPASTQKTAGLK